MLPSPFALQSRLSEFPAAAARLAVRRQGMDSCAQGSVAPRAANGLQIGQELRQSFQVGLEGRAPLRQQVEARRPLRRATPVPDPAVWPRPPRLSRQSTAPYNAQARPRPARRL